MVAINMKMEIAKRKAPTKEKIIFPVTYVRQTPKRRNNTRATARITFRKAFSLKVSIDFSFLRIAVKIRSRFFLPPFLRLLFL